MECLCVKLPSGIISIQLFFPIQRNFSAKKFCDSYFVADFDNKKILKEFIESSDFITIETENIPKHILKEIESKKIISFLLYY